MPSSDVAPSPAAPRARSSLWWTRRAVGLHATVAVVVPVFLGLFWWQVQRVRQGNTLSWAYVFEWPFFTGYAIYLWWKLVHDQDAAGGGPRVAGGAGGSTMTEGAPSEGAPTEAEDAELAAYNRYLANLDASGRPKRW